MARILYFNEEEHSYTDDIGNAYLSTTTMLGQFKEKFDTKGMAKRLARQSTGMYKNRTEEQIKNMWANTTKMACEKGSVTHNELEGGIKETSMFKDAVHSLRYIDENDNNRLFTVDDALNLSSFKPLDPQKFYDRVGHKYPIIQKTIEYYVSEGYALFAEIGIYDENCLISGMIDLWAFKYPYFVIIDWKTNKDEIKFDSGYYKRDDDGQETNQYINSKKWLKYPIDHLPQCKGTEYGLQLSTYAYMCEQRGLICGGLILFHIRDQFKLSKYGHPFRDRNNNYIVDESKPKEVKYILPPYYKDEVHSLFNYRKKTALREGIQLKIM